jgi:NitT/TauT family transport system ATP-binding protein
MPDWICVLSNEILSRKKIKLTFNFLNKKMAVEFNESAQNNLIQIKKASQSYDEGKTWILKDLQFMVEDKAGQGEFAAILGASGCGKSTLLRYIAGLQTPTSGEILLKGKPVADSGVRAGMVFQQYSSLPWLTVLENVALGLDFQGVDQKTREQKAMEMIELVGLAGHEQKYAVYPTLSGGQLQRVAIARSLMANPEILLMDEPFGALDINTRLQMQQLLNDIWQKFHPTILFVTHDIEEAVFLADEIYIMRANPGSFEYKIDVGLPFNRERELKREQKFVDLVREVEDKMIRVAEISKK